MTEHERALPEETIAAISTPPGRGGIGVVRVSGPGALLAAHAVLGGGVSLGEAAAHGRAQFVRVPDPEDPARVLDEAIVTAFHAPRSYTGGDMVEIALHGSPVVLEAVLRALLAAGTAELPVRLAQPGEFTQRAFLSGRLDLTQAEAVHDLIVAQTLQQARVAAQQLGGALSRRVAPAKERLLHLITLLEAGMDFASGELDDVDVVPPEQIAAALEQVSAPLQALAESFQRGLLLRNGASIALVGRPNAGKSSLFNRLLERERSIVTPLPGTTRDTIEESLALGGVPLRLIDTAGLRSGLGEGGADLLERQGIARTQEALADADLVIYVSDVTADDDGVEKVAVDASRPHVQVRNKVDLLATPPAGTDGAVYTSAVTGEGLQALREAILQQLNAGGGVAEGGMLNNRRQQQAVLQAVAALGAAAAANQAGLPHEVLLLDLHGALDGLDALTGTTTTEDILGRIFSTFCIGK